MGQHEVLYWLTGHVPRSGPRKNIWLHEAHKLAINLKRSYTDDVALDLEDLIVQGYLRRLEDDRGRQGFEVLAPCPCKKLFSQRNFIPSGPESPLEIPPGGFQPNPEARLESNHSMQAQVEESEGSTIEPPFGSVTSQVVLPGPSLVRRRRPRPETGPKENLSGMDLAFYWHKASCVYRDPDRSNLPALARSFNRWMDDGIEPREIEAMIDEFTSSPLKRRDQPPWRQFLGSASKIWGRLQKVAAASEIEANRYNRDYWL